MSGLRSRAKRLTGLVALKKMERGQKNAKQKPSLFAAAEEHLAFLCSAQESRERVLKLGAEKRAREGTAGKESRGAFD